MSSNNLNCTDASSQPTSSRPRKSSNTAKLIQAAALATVLVPLGTVAAEATPITCSFGGEFDSCNSPGSGSLLIFDWGPYSLELTFDQTNTSFVVTFDDSHVSQTGLEDSGRLTDGLNSFQGYVCLPLDPFDSDSPCIDFVVDSSENPVPQQGVEFTGDFQIFVHWDSATFADDPAAAPELRIRMLHNLGTTEGNDFDTDITVAGSYNPDPGVGGLDDNFQSFLITQAPDAIPEPASLLLVTTGLGMLYRRHRRRTGDRPGRSPANEPEH